MGAREDLEDVLKVQGGDIAAFERIVLRWQGPLINLAYRFCRDRSRAEDLAQEAFIRIYRGLSTKATTNPASPHAGRRPHKSCGFAAGSAWNG